MSTNVFNKLYDFNKYQSPRSNNTTDYRCVFTALINIYDGNIL